MLVVAAIALLITLITYTTGQNITNLGSSCQLGKHVNKVDLLNLHNQARQLMGGVDLLEWDDELACFSQDWAQRCVFEHSHREGYGENIAAGFGNNYAPMTGVQDWYGEIFGYKPSMGYSDARGHATQMGWKDTKQVGCGVAVCPATSLGLSTGSEKSVFLVCNYYPAGNVIDHFIGQVFVPSSNQMIDLKHNATKNDANPTLFIGNAKVQSGGSNNDGINYDTSPANDDSNNHYQATPVWHHHKHQHHHKHEQTVYTGNDGFKTSSWSDLQNWIKDKCAKGLSWSYSWKSTWNNSKRSIEAKLEDGKEGNLEGEEKEGGKESEKEEGNSRKGTSVFVANKRSLLSSHRRLQKKRQHNLLS